MIISLVKGVIEARELLTISFLKEEIFESTLKGREGVSLPYVDREPVPQQGA